MSLEEKKEGYEGSQDVRKVEKERREKNPIVRGR